MSLGGEVFLNAIVKIHLHPGRSSALQRPTLELALIWADTISETACPACVTLKFSLFEPSESWGWWGGCLAQGIHKGPSRGGD